MLPIPTELQIQFEEHLAKRLIPNGLHGFYKKWLRYYLDPSSSAFWGRTRRPCCDARLFY
jgi:hypothetical protein